MECGRRGGTKGEGDVRNLEKARSRRKEAVKGGETKAPEHLQLVTPVTP